MSFKKILPTTCIPVLLLLALLIFGGGVPESSAQGSSLIPYGQSGTWNLIFHDEFDGMNGDGTGLDKSRWVTCYSYASGDGSRGCGDDGAQSWYMPQNVVVSNGSLHLVTKQETVVGTDGKTYPYTSGMVTTGRIGYTSPVKFSYVLGYAEVRAKVPGTKGFWPSFWSLVDGSQYSVRPLPEIDTTEILTKDPTTTHMTYHGPVTSPAGTYTTPSGSMNFSQGWHIFATEWRAGEIVWYVDGVERYRFTNSGIEQQLPMYLLLTMGAGTATSWAGAPDASTVFPSEYEIDYMRVWQRAPSSSPTPTSTIMATATPIVTAIASAMPSATSAATATASPTGTSAATATAMPSATSAATATATPIATVAATVTPRPSATSAAPTRLVRINAGGPAYVDRSGRTWSGDAGFSGGTTAVVSNSIGAALDPALYQSERYGNFAYNVMVPNGYYEVTLKFAEIYWSAPGQRIFNVAINGQTVLSNFDIVAAGGTLAAVDRTFITTVITGRLTITFTTVRDNAKVSAIEIVPYGATRINAGGASYTEPSGKRWGADTSFTGGTAATTTAAIGSTNAIGLYQSERYGNFAYNVAVANGTYEVTLKFAEIYWSAPDQRVFNVAINGQTVLSNFDILRQAAPKTALDRTFTVTVTGGRLSIVFSSVIDYAKVSGIEFLRIY